MATGIIEIIVSQLESEGSFFSGHWCWASEHRSPDHGCLPRCGFWPRCVHVPGPSACLRQCLRGEALLTKGSVAALSWGSALLCAAAWSTRNNPTNSGSGLETSQAPPNKLVVASQTPLKLAASWLGHGVEPAAQLHVHLLLIYFKAISYSQFSLSVGGIIRWVKCVSCTWDLVSTRRCCSKMSSVVNTRQTVRCLSVKWVWSLSFEQILLSPTPLGYVAHVTHPGEGMLPPEFTQTSGGGGTCAWLGALCWTPV